MPSTVDHSLRDLLILLAEATRGLCIICRTRVDLKDLDSRETSVYYQCRLARKVRLRSRSFSIALPGLAMVFAWGNKRPTVRVPLGQAADRLMRSAPLPPKRRVVGLLVSCRYSTDGPRSTKRISTDGERKATPVATFETSCSSTSADAMTCASRSTSHASRGDHLSDSAAMMCCN